MFGHFDDAWHTLASDADGVWRTQCGRAVPLTVVEEAEPAPPADDHRCRACREAPAAVRPEPPRARGSRSGRCRDCAASGTRGRFDGYCGLCALRHGFASCGKCHVPFRPKGALRGKPGKMRCPKCAGRKRRGSVWSVGQAGSPGLGRGA